MSVSSASRKKQNSKQDNGAQRLAEEWDETGAETDGRVDRCRVTGETGGGED